MGCVCGKKIGQDETPTQDDVDVSTEHHSQNETEYSQTDYTETEHSHTETTDRRTPMPPLSLGDLGDDDRRVAPPSLGDLGDDDRRVAPPSLGGFDDDSDDDDGPLKLESFDDEDSESRDEVEILGTHKGGGFTQESSSDAFAPGETVIFVSSEDGNTTTCVIDSKIGEGSFGEVYKMADTLTDDVYALKVPLQQLHKTRQEALKEALSDRWEKLIGKKFGKTKVEPGTIGRMSVQRMTLGIPLELYKKSEVSDMFLDSTSGLFEQLGQMHGSKTGPLIDGIDDGFVHLDIADRNFLIVDGAVSLIDFGLTKHSSDPLLDDPREHHLVDGKPEVKKGPQYEMLITNLIMWHEGQENALSFDELKLDDEPVNSRLRENLSPKTMEALVLSGYIIKNLLPEEVGLGAYFDGLKANDTLFQKAVAYCKANINLEDKNCFDTKEWKAMKLADFCQEIVEKAKKAPVRTDASAFLEFMSARTVD